jgi:molybdopterin-binding protein
MRTLNAGEAAHLLHMNVKRVQGLARAGKLPAVRVGRRWLFPSDEIERLLGSAPPATLQSEALTLSARNRLRARITRIEMDGLMAEVHLKLGDQELISVITRSSAVRLSLQVGEEVLAVVKSTEVMIGKQGLEL